MCLFDVVLFQRNDHNVIFKFGAAVCFGKEPLERHQHCQAKHTRDFRMESTGRGLRIRDRT